MLYKYYYQTACEVSGKYRQLVSKKEKNFSTPMAIWGNVWADCEETAKANAIIDIIATFEYISSETLRKEYFSTWGTRGVNSDLCQSRVFDISFSVDDATEHLEITDKDNPKTKSANWVMENMTVEQIIEVFGNDVTKLINIKA